MPLSSLFSYVWTNPFASLPFGSLSTDLQRRFLSWVLKRSLGRFVRAGGLDVGRIQSQIGQGKVEIEGLELDTDEINSLIPDNIPLQVTAGSLDKVVAQLPFPNLWSAPLQITLDTLNLDLSLSSLSSSKGKSRDTRSAPILSPGIDLASSVTSAAEEFLHDELDAYEEAELDRSIRQSLILSQNDPFVDDVPPGGFPFPAGTPQDGPLPVNVESTTILAGLLERVLARLEFKVSNVRVRITHSDPKHGGIFELRIGEVRYADESSTESDGDRKRTVRAVKISKVNLYMSPLSPAAETPAPPRFFSSVSRSSSTSSGSSTSTGSSEGNNDMFMSMAVADLRSSTAISESASGTVYMSAFSEKPDASSRLPERGGPQAGSERPKRSRSATPTQRKEDEPRLVLSFGSDDIVLRMSTTGPAPAIDVPIPTPTSTARPRQDIEPPVLRHLPSIDVDISIGTIASLLLPEQVATILSSLQIATKARTSVEQPGEPPVMPSNAVQPKLEARFRIKGLYASAVYDLTAANDPSFTEAAATFWAKPSVTDLPFGHLKLRLDTLQLAYRFAGYTPTAQDNARDRPAPTRRISIARRGPPSPAISLTLHDFSIFEFLASAPSSEEDSPPGGSFPVMIFDPNLLKQYERTAVGTKSHSVIPPPVFPEFDGIDWRNSGLQRRGGPGEKVWRVKQKGRGVLKGGANAATTENPGPVIIIEKELREDSPAVIQVSPAHFFLDLSLVERLLPMLRLISPAVKHSDVTAPSSPIRPQRPIALHRQSESFVLDDLNAQSAKPSVVTKIEIAKISCPMLRLSIRCPAPPNRRGTWGDGAHLRSGIVTLDLHGLSTHMNGPTPASGAKIRKVAEGDGGSVIKWQSMMLFFSRVPSSKSAAFLVLGPLSPDPGDIDPVVLLPTVTTKSTQDAAGFKTSTISCQIPSVQAKIRQETIEGLQFFADDLTHWLDGAFGDGSRPKPRDELKMIGSRFFGGSKASSSTSSSMFEDEEDEARSATVIRVQITETDVKLHVPRSSAKGEERILSLKASDLSTSIESNTAGRQETAVTLTVMDAEFSDLAQPDAAPKRILGRTTPLTLTLQNHPIVQLRFSSLANTATGTKETSIKTILSSFAVSVRPDFSWIKDLAAFAKTPEGVFEDVVPSEVTRIALDVYDGSIHVTPPTLPGGAVIVLGALEVRTDLVSDAEENTTHLTLDRSAVLLVDDLTVTTPLMPGKGCIDTWKLSGYAQLVDLSQVEVQLLRDVGGGDIAVEVVSARVNVTACADSLATLGPFAADLAKLAPPKPVQVKVRPPNTLEQTIDVFASIEEDAFNRVPDMISGADLIEDDLPTNLDYLDRSTRRTEIKTDRNTGETLRTWQATGDDDSDLRLNSETDGDAVRVLVPDYDVGDDDAEYWDNTSVTSQTSAEDTTQQGRIRLRVQDCSLSIMLHDGYDWHKTRKAIEDEIKSVRRKLERIRQLLASGQTADESIENTRSVLFNSVYISLDQSQQMDHAALLAAIDEELGELGQDASSVSSWQTDFPSGHPNAPRGTSKKPRLRGKKLVRSRKPQIEIVLERIGAEFDLFGEGSSTASRVNVTVGAMEILDHIKTSTWKKFLTEMKADGRGNVRETGADMVRVELVGVRPSLPSLEEEYRLRAKILPLKLHVDQDALDFLKRFFSFTMPGSTPVVADGKTSAEPFLQHVEIFPIELKLDYKPKRVDFAALREGKTMELMNFFHFDGAEMTLRHVTLSGISGFSRLSTTLQDIWTPDVKANQLADVISGVSPIRSMVNVGSGVADLILLPIEQYRKDGRVARGVQRGTNSFVRSTALEMMKLGAKLATGTQVILERAEGVLGGRLGDKEVVGEVPWQAAGGSTRPDDPADVSSEDEVEVVSRYANQPGGAREGVQAAYKSLSKNVNAAAQTILAVPMEVYERNGDNGPLKAVVRAVPIAVLKPMIGASEAVSKTLLGMRNSLDPQGREELGDKYKSSRD